VASPPWVPSRDGAAAGRGRVLLEGVEEDYPVGELEEDDGGDLDFVLPPRVAIGADENGLKKVIEYRFDDDDNKVKVTTTTRVPSPP